MDEKRKCQTKECDNFITRRGTRCNHCCYLKQKYGSYDHKVESREEFFWRNIKKTDSCWLFMGCKNNQGYGRMSIKCKNMAAHRFSWNVHFGTIPINMFVLHKCDIRNCVNPEHLFLGTHEDNMKDMAHKGRQIPGNRKLELLEIKSIKNLIKSGERNYVIAKKFNMDASTISNIRHGKHWSNIL